MAAAKPILNALRINSWLLSSYFEDYAGSLSIAGRYGAGSAGLATRFWDIIGAKAVADALSIPDQKSARYARERFASLLPQQQRAANEIEGAVGLARPVSPQAASDLSDAVALMRLWVAFFESRLRLVEAVEAGYQADVEDLIRVKLDSAIEYSKSIAPIIQSIQAFVPIFNYSQGTLKESLLKSMEEEVSWLSNFDSHALIRKTQSFSPQPSALKINALYNYPNPFQGETTFIYELSQDADEVSILIYSQAGRRVRVLTGLSAQEGYNEAMWDGRDEDSIPLANGVYFYKIHAIAADEQVQALGRFAILR